MLTYVDYWKRYKYILTESARGFEFYFEENGTDFRVEIWQNFDESGTGTEVKIYNCAVPVVVSGMNTPTNTAGAVFGSWLKMKSPALAVGMLFHTIELVRLNHGRH